MWEDEDKIDAIKAWAAQDCNQWFDTEFIDSLADYLDEHDELTDSQSSALDTILARTGISVEDWV